MKKKAITAAELMEKLNADPDFVAKRALREEEHERRDRELGLAEAPLVAALRAVRCGVDSVWDLVNTPTSYPAAIPVLLEHLGRPYPAAIREGIARALGVPDAGFAWDVLVRYYRNESDERVKDGLAIAVAGSAGGEHLDHLIELCRDRANGPSRILLLSALERTSDPRARAALVELAADDELKKQISLIEKRLRRARRRARAGSPERSRSFDDAAPNRSEARRWAIRAKRRWSPRGSNRGPHAAPNCSST